MKYWVRYSEFTGGDTNITTEIMDVHPLIWEKDHPRKGTMNGGPFVIDWKEIPDSVAEIVQRGKA
jgi:hypothetical protein